ncbi:MAG: ribose-phosphate diphosphokinase [Acidilobus sp.]
MIVLPGQDEVSRSFASSLASSLGARTCEPAFKTFPDGESYVRIPCEVKGESVVVVKTMYPDQDRSFVTSILLADAAREAGAERVTLVAPYMAYARQDRAFLAGEAVSIRALMKALWSAGYSSLVTVEIHKDESLKFFPGQAVSVRPFGYMAKAIGISGDYVVLSPDLGALPRAKELAAQLRTEYDYIEKQRDRYTGEVTMKPKEINVAGRRVIIVDDIISTGTTVAKAAQMLRSLGALSVDVIVAHALLAPGAEERLREAGIQRVYAANTAPVSSPLVVQVDVAPLVAARLKEIVNP